MENLDSKIGALILELAESTTENEVLPSDPAILYGISNRHLSNLEKNNITEQDITSALRIFQISHSLRNGLLTVVDNYFRAGESKDVVQHKVSAAERRQNVRKSVVRGQDSSMIYRAA